MLTGLGTVLLFEHLDVVLKIFVRRQHVFKAVVAGFVGGSLHCPILFVEIDVALGAPEVFSRTIRKHVPLPLVVGIESSVGHLFLFGCKDAVTDWDIVARLHVGGPVSHLDRDVVIAFLADDAHCHVDVLVDSVQLDSLAAGLALWTLLTTGYEALLEAVSVKNLIALGALFGRLQVDQFEANLALEVLTSGFVLWDDIFFRQTHLSLLL